MSEHLLNEIIPFVMVITITGMVFTYLTIRLFLKRSDERKRRKEKPRPVNLERDQRDIDDALDRAEDLRRRIQNLEEILLSEKPKQD